MVVVSLYNHAQGYIYYDNRARLKKLVYVGSNLYNFKVYVYAMYEAPQVSWHALMLCSVLLTADTRMSLMYVYIAI